MLSAEPDRLPHVALTVDHLAKNMFGQVIHVIPEYIQVQSKKVS